MLEQCWSTYGTTTSSEFSSENIAPESGVSNLAAGFQMPGELS